MRGKCLDEGVLQSYLDGELSPEGMADAGAHISACERCAEALAAAESESVLLSAAFGLDESVSVPTERLRARIEDAIAARAATGTDTRRGAVWSFGAVAAWLAAPFRIQPRFAGAFASLLALALLVALLSVALRNGDKQTIATNQPTVNAPSDVPTSEGNGKELKEVASSNQTSSGVDNSGQMEIKEVVKSARIDNVGYRLGANRKVADAPKPVNETEDIQPTTAAQSVPGEETYLRTIASLSKVVELGGETSLKPTFRVQYERNLAVIDKAIEETRKTVARNPKDADAAQFLFSAYQSKIDLLSAAAEQVQVAALGR